MAGGTDTTTNESENAEIIASNSQSSGAATQYSHVQQPQGLSLAPEDAQSSPVSKPQRKLVSIIIPFYNEEDNVAATLEEIGRCVNHELYDWEVIAVNDGSSDATLDVLEASRPYNVSLVIVDLSRNFGKEAALSAGLERARGAAVIPLDADLQDPPELLAEMLVLWESGFDVVLAKRIDRSSDGALKRMTARAFYKVINRLSDVEIPNDVGDFRLMDRRVVDVLCSLPETRRFMKGLFAWAGFRTTTVNYTRPERALGTTKFSGWKLWNLALEGITSFSIAPLKIWTYIGFGVALLSFMYGGFIVITTLMFGADVPGYASLASMMLFMSGLQMMGLGVLGEYVGRTYLESKNRPPYVIRSVRNRKAQKHDD